MRNLRRTSAEPLKFADAELPISATVACTVKLTGISRSEIYRLLALRKIRAVKSGRTTLVMLDSILDHLASLPPAVIRAPAPRQGA